MLTIDINHCLTIVRKVKAEQRVESLKKFIEKNRANFFKKNAIFPDNVEKIHNIEEMQGLCPYCGYGSFTRYAVEMKDHTCVIFAERIGC